jgi:hypothetical protein
LFPCEGFSQSTSLLGARRTGFSASELFLITFSYSLVSWFSCLRCCQPASPAHSGLPLVAVAHGFPWLGQYYPTVRLLPESHVYLSRRAVRTHLGATGWIPNAFAPILRARPFPVFGRTVHHGLAPFDYGPAVLRMPFGFRLAADTLPSGWVRPRSLSRSPDLGISSTVRSLFPKLCLLQFLPYPMTPASELLHPLLDTTPGSRGVRDFHPSDSRAVGRTLWRL